MNIALWCVGLAVSVSAAVAGVQPGSKSAVAAGAGSKLVYDKGEIGREAKARRTRGRLSAGDSRMDDGSLYDTYTVSLSRGQTVTVDMSSRDFDSYLLIGRATGGGIDLLAEDDDSGSGVDARLVFTADRSGEFVIIANGLTASDRGTYDLRVDVSGGSSGGGIGGRTTGGLQIGGSHDGRLEPGSDERLGDGSLFDRVSFSGRRGQSVEISLNSEAFDPVLAVFFSGDDGLELLTSDDDGGPGLNSRVRMELPYSGEYVLLVNALTERQSGAYTIDIREIAQATSSPNVDWASRYPGGGDPNERYAVLVGIDDYPGVRSDLGSCVTDTLEMRRVLVEQFGYKDENIVLINDAEATRDHILTAARRHLGQAGPGGSALFYYSGHGTQLDENMGAQDNEPDGRDEALYVWGTGDRSTIILDEEIGAVMAGLRSTRRMVVLDSCHSGTGTLGGGETKRISLKQRWVADRVEIPDRFVDAEGGQKSAATDLYEGPGDHVLLAACRSDQVAMAGRGGQPSVFTYLLVQQLDTGSIDITLRELMSRVQRAASEGGESQVPQVEGRKDGMSLRQFFGV